MFFDVLITFVFFVVEFLKFGKDFSVPCWAYSRHMEQIVGFQVLDFTSQGVFATIDIDFAVDCQLVLVFKSL